MPDEDVYFSVDVETDGPIPGEFSMLSFAVVYAGRFDGARFERPASYDASFAATLKPIADRFEPEALAVNGLDREALKRTGADPATTMASAAAWIETRAGAGTPVLVAYPLGFDWSFLHWYFVRFGGRSPFKHSRAFDLKTAIAVRGRQPIAASGHDRLPDALRSSLPHTHDALADATAQADILANLFAWEGRP